VKHGGCLLIVIAAILLVSSFIPLYSYSPPQEKFTGSNFPVYSKNPEWVAYVECVAYTKSYYNYVVNWTLSYPHDYGFSNPGIFKTTIIVRDWKGFLAHLPVGCDVLGRNRPNQSDSLYGAAQRLKNITLGTGDYERLQPFFTYAEYWNKPKANWTQVHVTVISNDMKQVNKRPFLIVWLTVGLLSLWGIALYFRQSKIVLAGFLILLVLSSVFVGTYIKWEHEYNERKLIFSKLLELPIKNVSSGPTIAGVNADFRSPEDVSWFVSILRKENASLLSTEWDDYTIQLRVVASKEKYPLLLDSFREKGWEVSEISYENLTVPKEYIRETNETIRTLKKYLNILPSNERIAVEGYIEGLNETLIQELNQEKSDKVCITLYTNAPWGTVVDYSDFSRTLSKMALLVIAVVYLLRRRML